MKYPIVSITIPTLNEENVIGDCLKSIFTQDYPRNKLEVTVIDNGSTDDTTRIARKYKVKIIESLVKDAQVSKRIGFDRSKGEYWMWFDADMRMTSSVWLKNMIRPLLENKFITASVTCYKIKGNESSLTKFLTMDLLQRDPIYQFFSPSISKTFKIRKSNYIICKYETGKIPPQGMGLFRRKDIQLTIENMGNKFMDLDNLVYLVNLKKNYFAYLDVGIFHYFMKDIKTLVKKRYRNISKNYLGQDFTRAYVWFSLKSVKDVFKILFWILYVHIFLPETIRGIVKSVRHHTILGLYQPFVSLIETDAIIVGFAIAFVKDFIEKYIFRSK